MDRHTDVQHETIIPRHYHVAGYKNLMKTQTQTCTCYFVNQVLIKQEAMVMEEMLFEVFFSVFFF